MKSKAIFWDFDGTLVYSNESFLCSLDSALECNNYKFERDILKEFLVKVCTWYTPWREYTEMTGEMWWKELLDNLRSFCNEHNIKEEDQELICKQFRNNVITYAYVLYDDAEDILSYCKDKGFDNYILSNNFPELTEIIKKFGLDKYITDIFLSSNIGYEKPRVEIFKYAIEKANKSECYYMIGDNPIADIRGGKEAGLQTILVHKIDTEGFADHICENLIDIKHVL